VCPKNPPWTAETENRSGFFSQRVPLIDTPFSPLGEFERALPSVVRSERRRLATEGVVYTKHIALMYRVAANGAHEGRRRPWARHRPTRVGTTIASLKTAHCVGQRTIWPCVMASGSAASYRYGPGRVRIARWPHPDFGAKCSPLQKHAVYTR